MSDLERKKPFSRPEKDLFLNIIRKYARILCCTKTNAYTALNKKNCWEVVKNEFNMSRAVVEKATTKQLIELWGTMQSKEEKRIKRNMNAKARVVKTKGNGRKKETKKKSVTFVTEEDPLVDDIETIDCSNCSIVEIKQEENEESGEEQEKEYEQNEMENSRCDDKYTDKINLLNIQILEEELKYKQEIHKEELMLKVAEREYKTKMWDLEVKIKEKQLLESSFLTKSTDIIILPPCDPQASQSTESMMQDCSSPDIINNGNENIDFH